MRSGGKSNGESPFFETPNLSFEGRVTVRNVAHIFYERRLDHESILSRSGRAMAHDEEQERHSAVSGPGQTKTG